MIAGLTFFWTGEACRWFDLPLSFAALPPPAWRRIKAGASRATVVE
ncbi:hypothetical protein [Pseudomonas phoenicis]